MASGAANETDAIVAADRGQLPDCDSMHMKHVAGMVLGYVGRAENTCARSVMAFRATSCTGYSWYCAEVGLSVPPRFQERAASTDGDEDPSRRGSKRHPQVRASTTRNRERPPYPTQGEIDAVGRSSASGAANETDAIVAMPRKRKPRQEESVPVGKPLESFWGTPTPAQQGSDVYAMAEGPPPVPIPGGFQEPDCTR